MEAANPCWTNIFIHRRRSSSSSVHFNHAEKRSSGWATLTGVLLSIKPKYASEIIGGQKKFEFRKRPPRRVRNRRAYIYATAPVKRVVASFVIDGIVSNSPKVLWRDFGPAAGIDESSFFEYFGERKCGFAIRIGSLTVFKKPVAPEDLGERLVAPQSFRYVDDVQEERLESLGGLR